MATLQQITANDIAVGIHYLMSLLLSKSVV